jgi:hypothetical protein
MQECPQRHVFVRNVLQHPSFELGTKKPAAGPVQPGLKLSQFRKEAGVDEKN